MLELPPAGEPTVDPMNDGAHYEATAKGFAEVGIYAILVVKIGPFLGLILLILASLPACCGVLVEHRKIIATVAVVGGTITAIVAAPACLLLVGIPMFVIGVVTTSIGCCDFCGCCEAKYAAAKAREPLIGQPVYEQLSDNQK